METVLIRCAPGMKSSYATLMFLGILFFTFCREQNSNASKITELDYVVIDSIVIQSPYNVEFKYRDKEKSLSFYVANYNEIIVYDEKNRTQYSLDIRDMSPNLNYDITALAHRNDILAIVTKQSFNTIDLSKGELIYSEKELYTIAPSENSKIEFIDDNNLIGNIIPYFSTAANQFYGYYKKDSGFDNSRPIILNDSIIGEYSAVDKKILSCFSLERLMLFGLINPSRQLIEMSLNFNASVKPRYDTLLLNRFDNHPFDNNIDYDLSDLYHIPQIYDMFISDDDNTIFVFYTPKFDESIAPQNQEFIYFMDAFDLDSKELLSSTRLEYNHFKILAQYGPGEYIMETGILEELDSGSKFYIVQYPYFKNLN